MTKATNSQSQNKRIANLVLIERIKSLALVLLEIAAVSIGLKVFFAAKRFS